MQQQASFQVNEFDDLNSGGGGGGGSWSGGGGGGSTSSGSGTSGSSGSSGTSNNTTPDTTISEGQQAVYNEKNFKYNEVDYSNPDIYDVYMVGKNDGIDDDIIKDFRGRVK